MKRKKVVRMRGSKTHGWGSKKKHRGAGNRGGRGLAGSGKRGDAKKPRFWKYRHFGKYGFIKKGVERDSKAINISQIEENLKALLSKKMIEEKDGMYVIDIKKLGFHKVLGNGKVSKKFRVIGNISKRAAEKIKKVGGEVIKEGR